MCEMVSKGTFAPLPLETTRRHFAGVHALLARAVEDGVFPGCAFGVLFADGLGAIDAVGKQTYEPDSPAIEPPTMYDLASLTKVVATTAMAMLLYQRGLLALDLPVTQVLPGFRCGQPEREKVTVRHLLSHNSGLAGYARLFEVHSTAEALFAACLCMPLECAPSTREEYSDIGLILLGRILETLAGERLDSFCQREIFDPLGMRHTCFQPDAALVPSIPPTEDDLVFRHRVIQGEVQDENCSVLGGISGHAGLFGNVFDLLVFSKALLCTDDAGQLFQTETVALFAARTGSPANSSRALGWDTPSAPSSSGSMFSERSIGHLGFAGTSLWIDRTDRCAAVLLSNRTWPSRVNQTIRELRPRFHDEVRKCLLSRKAT